MSRTPTDWTIWLPKAFFLDWSDRTKREQHLSDPTIWLPLGIFPQEVREGIVNKYYIRISKTQGDIIGVGVQGSNSTISKNISNTGPFQVQLPTTTSSNQYVESLKALSESINKKLKEKQIPEEKIKSINTNLQMVAKQVQDVLGS